MAERLGDAVLELRTDDSKYLKGVRKARTDAEHLDRGLVKTGRSSQTLGRQLGSLGRGVADVARRFINWRTVLAGVAGVAGLGLFVTRSLAAADAIGKTADRIGLSTDGYQGYSAAAKLAGVETQQFNAAVTALIRRSGEAIRGNKAFRDAFEDIGISVAELRRLSPDELFLRVADALNAIEGQAQRVAAADRVMSEQGRQVINVFRGGADAIRAQIDELREFGIIVDEAVIRRAGELQNKLDLMNAAIGAQKTVIAVELAPLWAELVEWAAEWAANLNNAVQHLKEIEERGKRALEFDLSEALPRLERQQQALDEFVERSGAATDPDTGELVFPAHQQKMKAAYKVLREEIVQTEEEIERLQTALDKLNAPAGEGGGDSTAASDQIDNLGDSAETAAEKAERLKKALHDAVAASGLPMMPGPERPFSMFPTMPGSEAPPGFVPPSQRAAAEELAGMRRAADPALEAEFRLARIRGLIDEAGETVEQNAVLFDDLWSRASTGADRTTDAIQDTLAFGLDRMIDRLADGTASWEDMGRVAIDVIRSIVFNLAGITGQGGIGEALAGGIVSVFGGWVGGGGGGGGGPDIGAFQHGGSFTVPAVGSGGPDSIDARLRLSAGERVDITPRALAGRAGGNSYYIDARGADQAAIARLERTLVDELGPGRIERRAVAGVVDARRRNPRLFGR